MHLRLGTQSDYFQCCILVKHFIESTEYNDLYDPDHANAFVAKHLANPNGITIVLEQDGRLCGALAAVASTHPFIPVITTCDLCWWVEPEHRGSRKGLELLKAYEYWAIEKKKAKLVCLASMNNEKVDRIYERLGYTKTEHSWTKRVN